MTTEPYGKKNPFPAPVLSVRHITGEGSPKETIHIEYSLDGSGMNYIAGDALAVIPANDPALADALIDKLGLSPDSQVPTPEGETASLKDALVHCYDITNVNKALLTKWAAASGSQELDTLLAGDKDALSDFLWGRDVLDLATEYPASFESAEAFVGILKTPPAGDIQNKNGFIFSLMTLNIAQHLLQSSAAGDIQTTFAAIGISSDNFIIMVVCIFSNGCRLIFRRILLMFCRHPNIHGCRNFIFIIWVHTHSPSSKQFSL